jgi:hypothetical protein
VGVIVPSYRFVLVAEDSVNARVAAVLVDRTIAECAGPQWLRDLWELEARSTTRAWVSLEGDSGQHFESGSFTKLSHLSKLHPRPRMLLRGVGGKAAEVAKWIAVLEERYEEDAQACFVLSYDADDDPRDETRIRDEFERRRAAFEQGHKSAALLLALAKPEAEAWVIAAFDEQRIDPSALDEIRRELGFDPLCQPERLCSTSDHSKRDAKTILERIVEGREERARDILDEVPLADWRRRGGSCGIEALCVAVVDRVVPRIEGRSQ